MEKSLTQGSIKRLYFTYLGASFGSAMLSCVYGMVDAAVVGQYHGPQGAAVLSVVMPIWTILYSLGLLIGIGGSVNYSYYKAQGKPEKASAYFTLSLILTALVSTLCWVGITVFDDPLLRLFGADDTLILLAKEYLKPIKFVIPAFPFSQFLSAFLRNDGDPGRATMATIVGGIFNVVGDIYFVFGLDLGIFGAGLATALGCGLSSLLMLTHFFKKDNTLGLSRIYGHIHKTRLVTVSGFSPFLSDLAMGVVAVLFNRQIMAYLDSDALAVFGVIVQVSSVVQCSTYGVGQASQPLLSANYGAKRWDRIRQTEKYALWTVALMGLSGTAAMLIIPNGLVSLFMQPTEAVLAIAPKILRVYGLAYLSLPLNIFATYYFPSVGQAGRATVVSVARGIALCGILAYVLPWLFGSEAIWWVMPITEAAVAVYTLIGIQKAKP